MKELLICFAIACGIAGSFVASVVVVTLYPAPFWLTFVLLALTGIVAAARN